MRPLSVNRSRVSSRINSDPSIPVIDLFAGCGGLGEGFRNAIWGRRSQFRIVLSVECDRFAHQTLELRAFVRAFVTDRLPIPADYSRYLKKLISRAELFGLHPIQAEAARAETCLASLGDPNGDIKVESRISALQRGGIDFRQSVIIGGPPCQAYSVVGRSRRAKSKASGQYREQDDGRHTLYRHYLRLLTQLQPAAFVMENVRGILSAAYGGESIFPVLLNDLASAGYDLHALGRNSSRMRASVIGNATTDFLVKAHDFAVPQKRSRVFIVGTRKDLSAASPKLRRGQRTSLVTVRQALVGLPALRSGLSHNDGGRAWQESVRASARRLARELKKCEPKISALLEVIGRVDSCLPIERGVENLIPTLRPPKCLVLNHESRGHTSSDLERYLFFAAWSKVNGKSPQLVKLPRR